jgi:hypothetical protein
MVMANGYTSVVQIVLHEKVVMERYESRLNQFIARVK